VGGRGREGGREEGREGEWSSRVGRTEQEHIGIFKDIATYFFLKPFFWSHTAGHVVQCPPNSYLSEWRVDRERCIPGHLRIRYRYFWRYIVFSAFNVVAFMVYMYVLKYRVF
jgi:hypothetical protein